VAKVRRPADPGTGTGTVIVTTADAPGVYGREDARPVTGGGGRRTADGGRRSEDGPTPPVLDGGADVARRLRVMSFNVRYDADADEGARDWTARRDLVASVVRFHRPDVVGLQEPLAHQLRDLERRLPGYNWVGVGRDDGHEAGEFSPVGYRRDRLRRVGWDAFWLSESPAEPGSRSWGAALPRLVTWVELRDARTDRRLYAFNTHFDHESARAREESARLLRDRLTAVVGDDPAVVTGDFNCPVDAAPVRVLTDTGGPRRRLREAGAVSRHPHHGPTATHDRFAGEPTTKIDHVLVTDDVTVHQHGVLADHWDGRLPSDHCPVVAELDLE
jgi:endonuclease/exonuclease/phosphatase family metal-dependent hydrolase